MTDAFIFARGGSKGVPGKNLRQLAGKSLLAHAIDTARQAGIDRVIVSTDSDEIGHEATRCGAMVLVRPAELATDTAPEWLAWRHAVDTVRPDVFVSVPCVAPLRTAGDIEACLERFRKGGADIVLTVTPAKANPYFVMAKQNGGLIEPLFSDRPTRRQDAPEVFQIFAGCYVADPAFIRRASGIWEGKVAAVTIPAERAVDIDDEMDLRIAEVLFKERQVGWSSVQ